jgi:NAD(P)H-dependent flavin oxidoreductase YrpB (nitropropane dioxygenase family)
MGIGVSGWRLARAVSQAGQLGVVSGTALNSVLVRKLQDGDPEGHLRRAFAHCPLRAEAEAVWKRYFIEGGKPATQPYRLSPVFTLQPGRDLLALTVVANFAEIFLAKEGHDGLVGLNLLEKIQLPTLPSLYGAMLAGVDCVLMGAGIPRAIPQVLDFFAEGKMASLRIAVEGALAEETHATEFDPRNFSNGGEPPRLKRPDFLAIVSSSTLATTLARKASGRVDGFVVEGHTAGGHNAPPRGQQALTPLGEPLYGPRDAADLTAIRALGLPFWLAGSYSTPDKLREARASGACGVQIGTAFAFCDESGMAAPLKTDALRESATQPLQVRTDGRASPTGLPFKVVSAAGTLSEEGVYQGRSRDCDLGYLRRPYRREDGSIGYRCAAEPQSEYVRKGGSIDDTDGRKCLCNGLISAIGLAQSLPGGATEPAILTAGEDAANIARFLGRDRGSYTAQDVLNYLLQPAEGHH